MNEAVNITDKFANNKETADIVKVEGVTIPKNFYYVGGTKADGIVISDAKEDKNKYKAETEAGNSQIPGDDLVGNQFVWVPVKNIESFKTYEGYFWGEKDTLLSECKEPSPSGYDKESEEYNLMKESVEKNQGFLICPGDLTYYEADKDNPWTYIWVAFNGIKSIQYLKYANLSNKNLIFESPHNEKLKDYVLDMLKINKIRSNCDELKLQGLLYLFLSTISESIDNNMSEITDVSSDLYIEKSIDFINNNFTNNIKVTDIANYVGLNRSYLSSLFKKSLNLSPQEFLLKFRMNKAYELLKNPKLSVGDVSRSVGYMDPLTFSKTFKKYSGYSPKQYRENIHKNKL